METRERVSVSEVAQPQRRVDWPTLGMIFGAVTIGGIFWVLGTSVFTSSAYSFELESAIGAGLWGLSGIALILPAAIAFSRRRPIACSRALLGWTTILGLGAVVSSIFLLVVMAAAAAAAIGAAIGRAFGGIP
jgi:hypothetical protein